MSDTELLREAVYLLALLERKVDLDPDRDEIRITRQSWFAVTEPFRSRMDEELRRRGLR